MSGWERGAVAIVGAADMADASGELPVWGAPLLQHIAADAVDDAALAMSDVDGLAVAGGAMEGLRVAQELGLEPNWLESTHVGGSSFEVHVEHAAAAINAGLCETVLVVYAGTPRGDRRRWGIPRGSTDPYGIEYQEFEAPYGLRMPASAYALAAQRHMAVYGTTAEQLAEIAVSSRVWAAHNPRARRQDPITVDDVLGSPTICGPLHLHDCCLVTDGAAAVVITSAERARELRDDAAFVLGAASAQTHLLIHEMPDLTETPGARSGPLAFDRAEVRPDDVDVLQTYDSFTITVLLALEDLGFAKKGEGGGYVTDIGLGPEAPLPTNTSGGGLAYTHPGLFGLFLLVEATRQLRGESAGGIVPDVDVAVAHGVGGVLSATGTVVLGSEATR
ncbi:MAG: acetyl-CoA acetyltransferase [Xanthomonadales bacterium]|nr:acetyl-CoA acetyltransferase [Xanthomonadales bacterium]